MLDETDIPRHLLERSRKWFAGQVERLERIHGSQWEEHKEWLVDYLNAEIRDIIKSHA